MSVIEQATEVDGIERVPGVCGGYPIIAGTRIAVRHVVEYLQANQAGIDEFLVSFPDLTRQQVEAALIYYARFPEVVNEDIESNRRAWEALTGTPYDADPAVSG